MVFPQQIPSLLCLIFLYRTLLSVQKCKAPEIEISPLTKLRNSTVTVKRATSKNDEKHS